ncbi:MAG: gliding motility-associated C-terminal domain-containing protein [Bacteroidota bacterium]
MEDVFKQAFESFESDVRPEVWNNIQKSLKKSGSSSHTGSLLSKLGGKFILGSAAAGLVAVTTFIVIMNQDAQQPLAVNNTTPLTESATINTTGADQQPSGTISDAKTENHNISSFSNTAVQQPGNMHVSSPSSTATEPMAEKKEKSTASNTASRNGSENIGDEDETLAYTDINQTTSGKVVMNLQSMVDHTSAENNEITEQDKEEVMELISNKSVAKIAVTPKGGYAPLTVSFSNQAGSEYNEWNFGDGSSISIENSPTHVFEKPGTYTIVLKSTSADNKSGSDTITIQVLSSSKIAFIPNNFTPNGDGMNDVFKVLGDEIVSIKVVIYDRSGEMVAKWEAMDGGWDGINMNNGKQCPQGTYAYIVKCIGVDGKIYEYSGPITLKR